MGCHDYGIHSKKEEIRREAPYFTFKEYSVVVIIQRERGHDVEGTGSRCQKSACEVGPRDDGDLHVPFYRIGGIHRDRLAPQSNALESWKVLATPGVVDAETRVLFIVRLE